MGDGVRQPARASLVRAEKLQKALQAGAPPSFVPTELSPGSIPCSEISCSIPISLPPVSDSAPQLHFFEQMFQASPDALSIADCAHRVLWANEAFLGVFGYTLPDVIGHSLENLVVPADRLAESKWVHEVLARGERVTLETKRRKKDGTLVDVSLSCAPLLREGKTVGFYAGYRDISDRKRVEALSSALYRVAEKSSSAHDLQQFFAAVHSIIDELMYARNFYIALYDTATDTLSFP